jgi:hypothetical protein
MAPCPGAPNMLERPEGPVEISVISGVYIARRSRASYTYEASWWRKQGEVHWKADVFRDHVVAGSPSGTVTPAASTLEDLEASVRQSIEQFIDAGEEQAEHNH